MLERRKHHVSMGRLCIKHIITESISEVHCSKVCLGQVKPLGQLPELDTVGSKKRHL